MVFYHCLRNVQVIIHMIFLQNKVLKIYWSRDLVTAFFVYLSHCI